MSEWVNLISQVSNQKTKKKPQKNTRIAMTKLEKDVYDAIKNRGVSVANIFEEMGTICKTTVRKRLEILTAKGYVIRTTDGGFIRYYRADS